jgi:hypothetical protein
MMNGSKELTHLVLVVELDLEGILDGLGGVAVAAVVGS